MMGKATMYYRALTDRPSCRFNNAQCKAGIKRHPGFSQAMLTKPFAISYIGKPRIVVIGITLPSGLQGNHRSNCWLRRFRAKVRLSHHLHHLSTDTRGNTPNH